METGPQLLGEIYEQFKKDVANMYPEQHLILDPKAEGMLKRLERAMWDHYHKGDKTEAFNLKEEFIKLNQHFGMTKREGNGFIMAIDKYEFKVKQAGFNLAEPPKQLTPNELKQKVLENRNEKKGKFNIRNKIESIKKKF